ncbi:MAG TPA: hypothetical protein VF377_08755 [Acidimicrobiia bacterium]
MQPNTGSNTVPSRLNLEIRVIQDENVTAVSPDLPGIDHLVGTAKRHPADEHDPRIGFHLALSRLFARMAEAYGKSVRDMQNQPDTKAQIMKAIWDALGVPESERL